MAEVHVRRTSSHAGAADAADVREGVQLRVDTYSTAPAEGSATVDRPAALMYRIGGHRYPLRSEPKCKVCQSLEYRQEIETALLRGFSYTTIHRSLPERSGLSVRNIRDHVENQHLPLDEAMRRVLIEETARERGLSIEDHEGTLVDHITFAKLGVQRVVEGMQNGTLVPDIKDGIALASLLVRIQETAGEQVDNEVMVSAFRVYMDAIRRTCTPEQIRAIGEAISANPVMQGLMNRTAPAIPAASTNGNGSAG